MLTPGTFVACDRAQFSQIAFSACLGGAGCQTLFDQAADVLAGVAIVPRRDARIDVAAQGIQFIRMGQWHGDLAGHAGQGQQRYEALRRTVEVLERPVVMPCAIVS